MLAWELLPIRLETAISTDRIVAEEGLAFVTQGPPGRWFLRRESDTDASGHRSALEMLEDGEALGPGHAAHATIRAEGGGAYSHWDGWVLFSTRVPGDPRENGCRYSFVDVARPALWLHGLTWSVCGPWLLVAIWRRWLRVRPRVLRATTSSYFGSLIAVLAIGLVLAVASRWIRPMQSVQVDPRVLIERPVVQPSAPSDVAGASPTLLSWDWFGSPFPWIVEPLVEVVVPERDAEPRFELRQAGVPIPVVATQAAVAEARARGAAALHYWHGGLWIAPDPGVAREFELAVPVQIGAGTVGVLAIALLSMACLWRVRGRFMRGSLLVMLLAPGVTIAGGLSVVALGANLVGSFVSLRRTAIDRGEVYEGFGPRDVRLPWHDAEPQLHRRDGEGDLEFGCRATLVVSDTIAHAWRLDVADELRLRVPIWENWLLWFAGELATNDRFYVMQDPWKAGARGVGMCDQAATILVGVLRQAGIDARTLRVQGHVLAVQLAAGVEVAVLDPDYGVAMPGSREELAADPERIRSAYRTRLESLGLPGAEATAVDLERRLRGPLWSVGPGADTGALPRARRERRLYELRWTVPTAGLLLLLVSVGLLRASWRRAPA